MQQQGDVTGEFDVGSIRKDQDKLAAEGKVPAYPEFVRKLFKPMKDKMADFMHAAAGMSGEAGEVLDIVKKSWAYGKPLNREKLIEEMGDQRFYYQAMLNLLGLSDEDIQAYNKAKLLLRYPGGVYSDAAAIARADKAPDPVVKQLALGKPEVRIENWFVMGNVLVGNVYGHPRLPDGAEVTTSRIVHTAPDGSTIETANTLYRLGSHDIQAQ